MSKKPADIKLSLTKAQVSELWNVVGLMTGSVSNKLLHTAVRKRLFEQSGKYLPAPKVSEGAQPIEEMLPFTISSREHRAIAEGVLSILKDSKQNANAFGFTLDLAEYTRTSKWVLEQIGEPEDAEPIIADEETAPSVIIH